MNDELKNGLYKPFAVAIASRCYWHEKERKEKEMELKQDEPKILSDGLLIKNQPKENGVSLNDIDYTITDTEYKKMCDEWNNIKCVNMADIINSIKDSLNKRIRAEKYFLETYLVKDVYPNEKKGVVCVSFADGSKVLVRLQKGDKWCVETAVAYAIAKKMYGSSNAFTKAVMEATKKSFAKNANVLPEKGNKLPKVAKTFGKKEK